MIYGPPEIMPLALDREKYFIEMHLDAKPRPSTTEFIGLLTAKI